MKVKIKKTYIITLTEKEAQLLDMVLCDYENEGEQHRGEDYNKMNPLVDMLREDLPH